MRRPVCPAYGSTTHKAGRKAHTGHSNGGKKVEQDRLDTRSFNKKYYFNENILYPVACHGEPYAGFPKGRSILWSRAGINAPSAKPLCSASLLTTIGH
jgi:hypothetical protein